MEMKIGSKPSISNVDYEHLWKLRVFFCQNSILNGVRPRINYLTSDILLHLPNNEMNLSDFDALSFA